MNSFDGAIPRYALFVVTCLTTLLVGGCQGCGRRVGPTAPRTPRVEPTLLVRQSVPLGSAIGAIPRMTVESRDYTPPTAQQRDLARRAFEALADHDPEHAALLLSLVGFELLELHEGRHRYYLSREPLHRPIRGWGLYVLNPHASRPILIEAPHPENDRHTNEQAIRLTRKLDTLGLFISTSYRCATNIRSRCSGHTRACGHKQRWTRFRISDMGHTDRSVFQAAHEALFESADDVVAVQLHGFSRRPGRRMHIIISDGTMGRRVRSDPRLSNQLAGLLRKQIGRPKVVMSCNDPRDRRRVPLCGTTNVQGRHSNGSKDPCRKRARRSRNRFLHIEQSLDARTSGGQVDPSALSDALANLVAKRPIRRTKKHPPSRSSAEIVPPSNR